MGRKADPRGKDKTRSVSLSGDVAEIAENLAQKSQLSAVLSELLRTHYGFGDKIAEKERELEECIEQRKILQQREEHIISNIDAMKDQKLKEDVVLLPNLLARRKILNERHEKAIVFFGMGVDRPKYARQIRNLEEMLDEVDKQIAELKEAE